MAKKKDKTFRCAGCGEIFQYESRLPKYCFTCRKIKKNFQTQRYKKRRRRKLAKGNKEEHFVRTSDFLEQFGGAQYSEIARVLNMDFREVHNVERRALAKIRDNPELKKIWGMIKEELAAGGEFNNTLTGQANQAELLLTWQQSLAEWFRLRERLTEAECHEEAMECLGLIEQFQNKISGTFLTG